MNFNKSLIAASAFVALAGAAHAAVETKTLTTTGATTSVDSNGYTFSQLSGTGSLGFSSSLITALNLAQVKVAPVAPATVAPTTSTTSTGIVRYTSVSAAAPVTSLTSNFDGATLNVTNVGTAGGALQTTLKNSATNGPGELSISNLQVDLTNKIIYADILGNSTASAAGFTYGSVNLSRYALWSFDSISGPTSFGVNSGTTTIGGQNTITGLFLVNSADIDNIFVKTLGLNNTGRSGITSVNTRVSATGVVNTAGFGSILSNITASVAPVSQVPEPSTYVLMGLGLVGLGLARRRAAR
ncbi:putative secreted protein with PEP-CTERM sorting signal [Aquabacterium commune]|uniref:Putative secreted protein with PEP-CTERM sorting signal n=1 Tax=Aquabacterium commune TaxID=70586 RepID=A0A4R6RI42_9BURK|nr:PEP-CTERM sorting domain-containing protein [Aquabacterium commune]TDP86002.1 putative secreted protein with PEP-CTERM sorting signal [Aquabacterium commune]